MNIPADYRAGLFIGIVALALAGCATTPPEPDIVAQTNARLAARRAYEVDLMLEPRVAGASAQDDAAQPVASKDVTLRIDVTPANAEVWLLRNDIVDFPALIPGRVGGIVSEIEIPENFASQRAVLYVQYPRHIPLAYEFVPAQKNAFTVVLPEMPPLGFTGPVGADQVLGDRVRLSKLSVEGRVRDQARKAAAVREHALAQHPEWPVDWRNAIRNEKVVAGMSVEAVFVAWGRPGSKTVQGGLGGSSEIWYYNRAGEGATTLFFVEDKLVRWSVHQ